MEKFKIVSDDRKNNPDKYIAELEEHLRSLGFSKYYQNLKSEDFSFFKSYKNKYQIGLLIYDFRRHRLDNVQYVISIQFECMLLDIDYRCDLSVSNDIEVSEFEKMSEEFYKSMIKFK